LDPRTKSVAKTDLGHLDLAEILNDIRQRMKAFVDVPNESIPPPQDEEEPEQVPTPLEEDDEYFASVFGTIAPTVQSPVPVLKTEEIIEAELHAYSEDPRIPAKTSDKKSWSNPLHWRRDNETRYPLLARVAATILHVPASSASSERTFSVAGLTLGSDRVRLLPDNADALIFLKTTWDLVAKHSGTGSS